MHENAAAARGSITFSVSRAREIELQRCAAFAPQNWCRHRTSPLPPFEQLAPLASTTSRRSSGDAYIDSFALQRRERDRGMLREQLSSRPLVERLEHLDVPVAPSGSASTTPGRTPSDRRGGYSRADQESPRAPKRAERGPPALVVFRVADVCLRNADAHARESEGPSVDF